MMKKKSEDLLNSAASKQWKSFGTHPHHGINVPLFSLRTQKSAGIGEFPDLIPLIDWCSEIGLDIIQLLPLNDGGPETSPYCALSASALNPLFLGLASLPNLEDIPESNTMLSELQKLSRSQRINYPHIQACREKFLRRYYERMGPDISASQDFLLFQSTHPWLEPYTRFKAIKIARQWQPWDQWPLNAGFDKQEAAYHSCIQYLCFKQMESIKKYAENRRVLLKGDIPILLNRESADVWHHRNLFLLNLAAGAPPDIYAKEGQMWGFPLYNWESMEKQGYQWWKERLGTASWLYHLYRIDHIVGFFRIWAIPLGKLAKEGYFIPENPADWLPQGEKIMNMILQSCPMLPIGEDLGVVPPEVRACLSKLGICGTKVMRWERVWDEDKRFIPIEEYSMDSMTTVSTHDSDTLQLWWKKNPEEAKEYSQFKGWDYISYLTPEHQFDILYDSHHTASLFHINLLQEYLALVPGMIWPDPEDERINIPGLILESNWSYRYRPYLEEIIDNPDLRAIFKEILSPTR